MDNEKILLRFGKSTILMNKEGIWLDAVHIGLQEKELNVPNNTGELQPLYRVQFHCVDDNGKPYVNTPFTIQLPDNEQQGITDANGYTPVYFSHIEGKAKIRLHIETLEREYRTW